MQYRTFLLSIVIFFTTVSIHAQTLQQNIDGLIEQTLPHATIGIFIQDAQSGQIIYERNANKLLNPASNVKLFTAAAALYYLGPNDRYITSLSQHDNNFYITFSGSPALKTNDLRQLLQTLNQLGIKTITGNIVLDTHQFKPPYHAPGASYDDLGWYYEAPSTAVILNGNAIAYDFISAKTLGMPVQIKPQTSDNILTLINEVSTVSKAQAKDHCNLNIEILANNTLRLYGCLSQEKAPRKMQLAIPNPTLYATKTIRTILKENNILLKGMITKGKKPIQAKIIASHQSADLTKLLTHMLKESDNLYADSLTKRLAYSLTGQGTYKEGVFAIKKILAEHGHLDMNQIELADGQGTRYNMLTPRQLVVFLTVLYQDEKIKPIFLNALPRMGVSGTLKDRMKNTGLEKNVLAKTGSMHDISALSGYLTTPTGKILIFSIISNGIDGKFLKAKTLEEKILLAVSSEIPENLSNSDIPTPN